MSISQKPTLTTEQYELVGEFVSIYQRKNRWYSYYRYDGKSCRQSLKTNSKKQAKTKALAIERDLLNGQVARPARAPSLEAVIAVYLAHLVALGRSPKTIAKYKHCFGLVLKLAAVWKITRIDQLSLAFVDAFRSERTSHRPIKKKNHLDGLAAAPPRAMQKTIHNDVVLLKQLVNFAVHRKMIRENPLADLKLSQPKRTPQPFWTRDRVELILNAVSPQYRPLFQFLADTGTRIGEARWLTWADVDLDNKVVHIRPKEGWQPKTGNQRVVPLSGELCQILGKLPKSANWVFTAPRSDRHPAAGRQVSDRRALGHLKTVLKRLGVPGHLHTFRHSFISHAAMSGVPEAIIREWVGHVDREIIRVYMHVADQQSRRAMEQMLPESSTSRRPEDRQH